MAVPRQEFLAGRAQVPLVRTVSSGEGLCSNGAKRLRVEGGFRNALSGRGSTLQAVLADLVVDAAGSNS